MSWRDRIGAARIEGEFPDEDIRDAGSWARCAVGEQWHAAPTLITYLDDGHSNVFPVDGELRRIGTAFHVAVRAHSVDQAEDLLDQIEDRVLQLKRDAE